MLKVEVFLSKSEKPVFLINDFILVGCSTDVVTKLIPTKKLLPVRYVYCIDAEEDSIKSLDLLLFYFRFDSDPKEITVVADTHTFTETSLFKGDFKRGSSLECEVYTINSLTWFGGQTRFRSADYDKFIFRVLDEITGADFSIDSDCDLIAKNKGKSLVYSEPGKPSTLFAQHISVKGPGHVVKDDDVYAFVDSGFGWSCIREKQQHVEDYSP